jgi:hypothetical protein
MANPLPPGPPPLLQPGQTPMLAPVPEQQPGQATKLHSVASLLEIPC